MDCLINDAHKKKVLILYSIRSYENRLQKYQEQTVYSSKETYEILGLCDVLIQSYQQYLQLLAPSLRKPESSALILDVQGINSQLVDARNQLFKAKDSQTKISVVSELIDLYQQLKGRFMRDESHQDDDEERHVLFDDFKSLAAVRQPQEWFTGLLMFCNKHKADLSESAYLYFLSRPKDLKNWVVFFTEQDYINLFHAVYYFKQYPEKLYDHPLSSEKLLSVSKRLMSIYQLIEQFQQQVITLCFQHHLPAIKDYLFHGDGLPPGVVVQVEQDDRICIQNLVKLHGVNFFICLDKQNLYKKLYELNRAYKYWFNPSRLVDAVMVLQQLLVNQPIDKVFNESIFQEKMMGLYKSLNTTDCLDLYGNFSNKDTSYLLRILNVIVSEQDLSCLAPLQDIEKKAILRVFQALLRIMDALREELTQRNITTDPYPLNFSKPIKQPGRRNISAVKRVIAVYGKASHVENSLIEDLFHLVEE